MKDRSPLTTRHHHALDSSTGRLPRAVVEVGVPRRPGAVESERELLVVLVLLTPHPKSLEHFCCSTRNCVSEPKVRRIVIGFTHVEYLHDMCSTSLQADSNKAPSPNTRRDLRAQVKAHAVARRTELSSPAQLAAAGSREISQLDRA